MTVELQLGDRVRFSGIVEKSKQGIQTVYREAELPRLTWGGEQTDTGVIVGKRTLRHYRPGDLEYDYDGMSRVAYRTEPVAIEGTAKTYYIVAWHMSRKTVLVPADKVWRTELPDEIALGSLIDMLEMRLATCKRAADKFGRFSKAGIAFRTAVQELQGIVRLYKKEDSK